MGCPDFSCHTRSGALVVALRGLTVGASAAVALFRPMVLPWGWHLPLERSLVPSWECFPLERYLVPPWEERLPPDSSRSLNSLELVVVYHLGRSSTTVGRNFVIDVGQLGYHLVQR